MHWYLSQVSLIWAIVGGTWWYKLSECAFLIKSCAWGGAVVVKLIIDLPEANN